MKFCADCRFFEAKPEADSYTCGAVRNIVTGEVSHLKCEEARSDPQCGPSAIMFKEAYGTAERRMERDRREREARKSVDPAKLLATS